MTAFFRLDYIMTPKTTRSNSDRLLKRSLGLEILLFVSEAGTDGDLRKGEGQAFLVDTGNELVMVTVKHNFCQEINTDGKLEECHAAYLVTPESARNPFPFDRATLLNWDSEKLPADNFEPSLEWKYGKELEFIAVKPNWLLEAVNERRIKSFKAVSTTFKVEEDMQVGIVARSCLGVAAASLQNELGSGDGIYEARTGDVFITIGKISRVGREHIEYDVNTVPGFSGSPVILLDPGSDCHMKVIAAHAGYSKARGANFGFLVADEVEQYGASRDWWSRIWGKIDCSKK